MNNGNIKEINSEELFKLYEDKIQLGEQLIKELELYKKIDGVPKIQRRINQELKFLNKVKNSNQLKVNHVICSNLIHFNCLINTLKRSKNILYVDHPLQISEHRNSPLRIDIICDNGSTWIKVIARNPKSLIDSVHGRASYGSKSIIDQANEFITSANENHCCFKPPKVIFEFAHKIDDDLVKALQECGIEINLCNENVIDNVNNDVVDVDDELNLLNINKIDNLSLTENIDINKINLDITTLIAYVSSITNGNCNWEFMEPILNEQAEWERKKPVKLLLDKLFIGKELICCETAVKSFMDIILMMGGKGEHQRAIEFLNKIKILPDIQNIPKELQNLIIGGKIKPRSLQIFSFGIYHKAITITSNEGFIRSAKMKGNDIPVFIHEARALTEQKQATGKLIV